MYLYQKQIPLVASPDILVVGSGSAGSTAAITAAREAQRVSPQAEVLLVERYGFLGGISTGVLDTFYGFYTPGRLAKKVVSGIPDDVVAELNQLDRVIERPNTFGAGTGITYNPEILKVVWERLAERAGVHLLYHTFVTDVVMEGERIAGVIVSSKSGLGLIRSKIVIDASGEADVAAWAGVPFEMAGERAPAQTLTTTFRLANVDVERARSFPRAEFLARMAESGQYDLSRRDGSVHATPVEGVMATIMTRVKFVDPTQPEQLTRAEFEGRRQALEYERFLREQIPGYKAARIVAFSTQIGVRESRRIYGEYRLTREDVIAARKFEDAIGLCGAPIEDHHPGSDTRWDYLPEGETVGIPYRTLVPQKVENLLVAGRCFSATHDAHAAVRSMAQCMAMGQAVGCAAALCLARHQSPRELPVPLLQQALRSLGATLEIPAAQEELAGDDRIRF
ncbi:MAG: FAD-dependent oxidoreductase [Terriglobia bacterium]